MYKLIIFIAFTGLIFSFTTTPFVSGQAFEHNLSQQDTIPSSTNEALVQEWLKSPRSKTWEDSGYYFQLEPISWLAKKLGIKSNGDVVIQVSFSSGDPSSLRYRGQASFSFDPNLWPENIMPSRGMRGVALIAFPQSVLFCPSPSQEAGLGQNDPSFPLYLSGEITGVNGNVNDMPGVIAFGIPVSVQLRDLEIVL